MNEIMKDNHVRKAVLALLVLLSVFFLIKSLNELKANKFIGKSDFGENIITVTGEGEVSARPDIATLHFTVSEEADEVKSAQDVVSRRIDQILNELDEFDIDDKDVKTTSYNIYPRYDYVSESRICPQGFDCPPPRGERVLAGYEVSQSVSIKVRDLEKSGEILGALGELSVSNVNGPFFDIEDKEELMREARKEAIQNAKKKAEQLAKDLGVELVGVVRFSEGGNFRNEVFFAKAESLDTSDDGSITPQIPSGENEITSFVEIEYEIR